jgi:hypothetical protein
MKISKERLEELRQICKKDFNTDLTDQELHDVAFNLVGYYDALSRFYWEDMEVELAILKNPKGLPASGKRGGNCQICGTQIDEKTGWQDKWGFKCLDCQRAVDKKQIPGYVCQDHGSWYGGAQGLSERFNLPKKTINAYIKQGKLKSRDLKDEQGNTYLKIYLLADNESVFGKYKVSEADMHMRDYRNSLIKTARKVLAKEQQFKAEKGKSVIKS